MIEPRPGAGVAVIEEVVADEGYHSRTTVHDLETLEFAPTSENGILCRPQRKTPRN